MAYSDFKKIITSPKLNENLLKQRRDDIEDGGVDVSAYLLEEFRSLKGLVQYSKYIKFYDYFEPYELALAFNSFYKKGLDDTVRFAMMGYETSPVIYIAMEGDTSEAVSSVRISFESNAASGEYGIVSADTILNIKRIGTRKNSDQQTLMNYDKLANFAKEGNTVLRIWWD